MKITRVEHRETIYCVMCDQRVSSSVGATYYYNLTCYHHDFVPQRETIEADTEQMHIWLCSAGVTWLPQEETLLGQWALVCFVSSPENICGHVIIWNNTHFCLWASVGTHEGIKMNMTCKQEYGCHCEVGQGVKLKPTTFVHGNCPGPEQCSLVWVVKGKIHQFT
jgi:hypothetical protein